jgi:streptomycin 6-kinase
VEEEWLADRERIHRECLALRLLAESLPKGAVPEIAFEDPDSFIFAMEAAPETARDWKSLLLAGECEDAAASRAAEILVAQVHAEVPPELFADQRCFDQLRLDPYYRFTASRHPDLREHFEERIAACRRPLGLVHGDFSPKNLLLAGGRMMVIDFEVIHLGDPNFDVAFLLNHLLLKVTHGIAGCGRLALIFWDGVRGVMDESSTIAHLGCLHLARVDGKSPAEYLTEPERKHARARARELILHPPRTIREIFA